MHLATSKPSAKLSTNLANRAALKISILDHLSITVLWGIIYTVIRVTL